LFAVKQRIRYVIQHGYFSVLQAQLMQLSSIVQFFVLPIVLVVVNGVALVLFGVDKLTSKTGGWRVPETRLLLAAFFGPFGA
jgi:hypothetical protein